MKKIKFFSLITVAVLALAGCSKFSDFAVPSSFAVKTTKADYSFTVVNLEDSDLLSKNFNIADAFKKTDENQENSEEASESESGFDFSLYNPGGNSETLQMAMQMSLQDIQIDFSEYFKDTDLTKDLESMKVEKTVQIPDVSKEHSQSLEIENLDSTINKLIYFYGTTSSEPQEINVIMGGGNDFESLTYSYGYLAIRGMSQEEALAASYIDGKVYTGGNINGSVTLKHGAEVLGSTEFKDNLALISLDNTNIYRDGMTLEFDGAEEGIDFIVSVYEDSKLKSASNLTLADPLDLKIDTQTFEIENDSDLVSCEIEEGSLTIAVDEPPSWENVDLEYTINLSGSYNADLNKTDNSIDLAGKSLENADITAEGTATVTLKNSTLVFTDMPELKINLDVKKIASAVVKLDDSFKSETDITQELPDDTLKFIKKIKWNPSGIKITYENRLPEGNDIVLSTSSSFLDISKSETIYANTTKTAEDPLELFCEQDRTTVLGKEDGEFSTIDFKASVSFVGYDEENKTLEVKNVEPNETYSLSLNIEPVFDWEEITIKPDDTNQNGSINTGMNLGSVLSDNEMFKDFAENVELTSVPVYLYCDFPKTLFDDAKFSGKIKAFLADKEKAEEDSENLVVLDGTEPIYFLGSVEGTGDLEPAAVPEIAKNEDGEITTNFADIQSSTDVSPSLMAGLINDSLSNSNGVLCLDYSLGLSSDEITVSKEQFEKMKEKSEPTSIKIAAAIVLPLEFNVKEDFTIALDSMLNKDKDEDWDLLNRKAEDNTADKISKYLSAIDEVGLAIKLSKLPIKSDSALRFEFDMDGEGGTFDTQTVSLDGKKAISLEPQKIIETNPLQPSFGIVVPQGNFSFKRDMNISMNVKLNISTKEGEILDFAELFDNSGEEE